ncbi:hypothetical protein, partial [Mesorhizobium sp. M2A.F.Ca.ET.029.05.1.1]
PNVGIDIATTRLSRIVCIQMTFATLCGCCERAGSEEGEMVTAKLHGVELVRGQKWTVRVTAYGTTLIFPFEAEQYARSYADGQAFRLGVEVVELKDCA